MKKVSEELRYDGASIEQVHEMLANPAFREQVCVNQRYVRHTVQIERAGHGMTVTIDQVQGAKGIPGFARKFVGDAINIVQSEDWTSPEKGNIHVTIPGKPGEIVGSETLEQSGDDVVQRIDIAVTVSMPFVGGKVEDLIAGFVGRVFEAENTVGVKWLAGEWRV